VTSGTIDSSEGVEPEPDDDDDLGRLEFVPPPGDKASDNVSDTPKEITDGAEVSPSMGQPETQRKQSLAATSPSDKSFHVGDVVSPADRDNQGTVVAVDGDVYLVQFVNRETGDSAERYFGGAELRMIRKGAGGKPPLRILSYAEMLALRPPPYLIDGLLRQMDLAVLYGDPGSGKSFAALDFVMSIAALPEWRGRRVFPGPILYVAAEGVFGLRARALAWQQRFAPDSLGHLEKCIAFIGSAVQLSDDEECGRFTALLEKRDPKPALIVFDTLSRCSAGADENSVRDMGAIVLRLDEIRQKFGCAVLLLHHSGKDGKKERGSTAIRGAADVMLRLAVKTKANRRTGTPMIVELTCEKAKDESTPDPIHFALRVVEAVDRSTGEVLQSCILEDDAEQAKSERSSLLTHSEREVAALIYRCFREGPASKTEIKEASSSNGIKKSTLYAAITNLVEKKVLAATHEGNANKYRLTELGLRLIRGVPPPEEEASAPPEENASSNDESFPRASRPVQRPSTPKGGVDGSGLDCPGSAGAVQSPGPVQNSPSGRVWTGTSEADVEPGPSARGEGVGGAAPEASSNDDPRHGAGPAKDGGAP